MRACSPALLTLLTQSPQLFVADLLTLTLPAGLVVRLTSGDVPVTTPDGRVFPCSGTSAGPVFTRDRVKTQIGTAVSSLTCTLAPDPALHTLGGLPWPAAVVAGALDGARVLVETAYFPQALAACAGTLIQFAGRVAKADPSRTTVVLTVNSDLELLNVQMPRTLYQPGCAHSVYDAGCGLSRAAWQVPSTAAAGSTTRAITSGRSEAPGYFELGTLTFTGGALAGLTRSVTSFAGGTFGVALPWPVAPAVGDPFVALPGCHKTQSECTAKFGNLVRFKGYPYIPDPDAVTG